MVYVIRYSVFLGRSYLSGTLPSITFTWQWNWVVHQLWQFHSPSRWHLECGSCSFLVQSVLENSLSDVIKLNFIHERLLLLVPTHRRTALKHLSLRAPTNKKSALITCSISSSLKLISASTIIIIVAIIIMVVVGLNSVIRFYFFVPLSLNKKGKSDTHTQERMEIGSQWNFFFPRLVGPHPVKNPTCRDGS